MNFKDITSTETLPEVVISSKPVMLASAGFFQVMLNKISTEYGKITTNQGKLLPRMIYPYPNQENTGFIALYTTNSDSVSYTELLAQNITGNLTQLDSIQAVASVSAPLTYVEGYAFNQTIKVWHDKNDQPQNINLGTYLNASAQEMLAIDLFDNSTKVRASADLIAPVLASKQVTVKWNGNEGQTTVSVVVFRGVTQRSSVAEVTLDRAELQVTNGIIEIIMTNCKDQTVPELITNFTLNETENTWKSIQLPFCGIKKQELCKDNQCWLGVPDTQTIIIEEGTGTWALKISQAKAYVTTAFYLRTTTHLDEVSIHKFTVFIERPKVVNTAALTLTNTLPSFEAELESTLTIKTTKDSKGNLVDSDQMFKYISPKATDTEGNQIVMAFSGLESLPGTKTKLNSDGSFIFTFDRLFATKTETLVLQVELGDSIASQATFKKFQVSIDIEYIELEPEPEPEPEVQIGENGLDLFEGGNTTQPEIEEEYFPEEPKIEYVEDYEYVYYNGDTKSPVEPIEPVEEAPPKSRDEMSAEEKRAEYKAQEEALKKSFEKQRLNQLGFKKSEYGQTFPSVNIDAIKALREQVVTVDAPPPPPAKLKIGAVSAKGEIGVEFNQDMVFPETIDQSIYKNVFQLGTGSDVDGSIAYGRSAGEKRRRLNIDEQSAASEMQFTWEVTEHSGRGIKVKANFANPGAISSGVSDALSFEIKELSLFKTVAAGDPLDISVFDGAEPVVKKVLPPIIQDEELADSIGNSTASAGDSLNFLTTGNFFVSLVLSGSMSQLWGMIRAIQMMSLTTLIDTPIPAPVLIFYQGCIQVAAMDIFGAEDWYSEYLKFNAETEPYNANFEMFGIGDMNFVNNSGPYFIIIVLMMVEFIALMIINYICSKLANYALARWIGVRTYAAQGFSGLWNNYLKLFLEAYFDNCFCAMINTLALIHAYHTGTFALFFSSITDATCSVITIFHVITLLAFPVWTYLKIRKNLGKLDTAPVRKDIGFLYEGIKTKKSITANYTFFFLMRRLMTMTIICLLTDTPILQFIILLVFSKANVIYLLTYKPLATKRENRIEFFNELCILFNSHLNNIFLNAAIPYKFRDQLGWVVLGVASLNILVNVLILLMLTTTDIYGNFSQSLLYRRQLKRFSNHQRDKAYLLDQYPEIFSEFKTENAMIDAIVRIKVYVPQRKWMITKGIDFSKFDEEIIYQENKKKFNLESKAYTKRLTKALISSAAKKSSEIMCEAEKKRREQAASAALEKFNQRFKILAQKKLMKIKGKKSASTQPLQVVKEAASRSEESESSSSSNSDSSSSEEQAETKPQSIDEIKAIFRLQFGSLTHKSVLRGFKPQVQPVDFNYKDKITDFIENEAKVNGIRPSVNEALQRVRKQENSEEPISKLQKLVLNDQFDTQFMLEDIDHDDYGEQVYEEFYGKTKEDIVQEYDDSNRLYDLNDLNPHGLTAALVQCILEMPFICKFLIMRECDHLMSSISIQLDRLIQLVVRDTIPALKQGSLDTKELTDKIEPRQVFTDIQPEKVMNRFITLLEAEEGMEINFKNQKEVDDMDDTQTTILLPLTTTYATTNSCKKKHETTTDSIGLMTTLNRESSILQQLEEKFARGTHLFLCEKCKEKVNGFKKKSIKVAPQVFQIALTQIDQFTGEKVGKSIAFPLTLSLTPFLQKGAATKAEYELFSMIFTRTDDDCCNALVLKPDGKWYVFLQEGYEEVTVDKITKDFFEPALLCYRLLPDQEEPEGTDQIDSTQIRRK